MKKLKFRLALRVLVLALACACLPLVAAAQQGSTTRYVYDDNGRLHAVIAPNGEAAIYDYDAAGNLTAIRRLPADALAIFNFSPRAGAPGDLVTFVGIGFGGGVTAVSFNGTTGRVVEFTAAMLIAEVPEGATTGPVTITSTHGSVTTSEPFTIKGVRITPAIARINFGETQQFVAQVLGEIDQNVTWSVNSIPGGNTTIGTITAGGLYTAPNREMAVTINAASVTDSTRYGTAVVNVRNPDDVQAVLSPTVSVSRGGTINAASAAPQVAVQYGLQSNSQSTATAPVAVQYGNPSGVSTAVSSGVAVERGSSTGATAITQPGVAVRYGSAYGMDSANSLLVSTTIGPDISGIVPNQITRGTTITLTVNGSNLGGATKLRFIKLDGTIDTTLTASNLSVNAEGTSVTATLAVTSSAALGQRIVVVATPNGDTLTFVIGPNTIEIVAP